MSKIIPQKMTVEMDGEFVVYLVGMRINKPWKIHKWLPVFLAMPRMLKELADDPESGLLGFRLVNPLTVLQYWRSFEHLEAYARNKNKTHAPAWSAYYKAGNKESGDVGIWHETYRIPPGCYEVTYRNMPPFGLGEAGRLVPATTRHESARERMYQTNEKVEVGMT